MINLKYLGDFNLKGFLKNGKDAFCEGTYYKAIGNGSFILIRQNREILIKSFDIISSKPDVLKPILDKLNIPYEEIEIPDRIYLEKDLIEETEEREDDLEWQER